MSKPIIEVKDYSYRYASTEELVLKNITFTVNEGDFVGVVGCNRAGKSTLCKSIVGILPFVSGGDWSGEIVIDGKSLNDTKGNGTTDVVGIVFQDAESQFTQQTVEDEIAFAMCNFGYERNQMRERVKFAVVLHEGELVAYDEPHIVFGNKNLLNEHFVRVPQVTDAAIALRDRLSIDGRLPITLQEATPIFALLTQGGV